MSDWFQRQTQQSAFKASQDAFRRSARNAEEERQRARRRRAAREKPQARAERRFGPAAGQPAGDPWAGGASAGGPPAGDPPVDPFGAAPTPPSWTPPDEEGARRRPPAGALAIALAVAALLLVPLASALLPHDVKDRIPVVRALASDGVEARVRIGANVRSGPGLGHRVVGSLAAGRRVRIRCRDGAWLELAAPYDGRYVHGNLVAAASGTRAC